MSDAPTYVNVDMHGPEQVLLNCSLIERFKMPVYEYKCECNDKIVPFNMSIKDYQPLQACPECSKDMQRHYTPAGIQFKGNGFYKTDNPR